MAIEKLSSPSNPPSSNLDWGYAVTLIEKAFLNEENGIRIDYDRELVLAGSVFQVGGSVYIATSDTSIDTSVTGSATDYVKLTLSGSNLDPSYVANLTGVTWNVTNRHYEDAGGNLYVFDEMKARMEAVVSTINSNPGNYANNVISGLDGFVREMKVSAIGSEQFNLTASGWYQVNIGNTNYNLIPGASLASNILTLPAGRFLIKGFCNFVLSQYACCRLYNISDSTVIDYGSIAGTETGTTDLDKSHISSYLILASTKNIKLEYYVQLPQAKIGASIAGIGSAENVALHIQQINRD